MTAQSNETINVPSSLMRQTLLDREATERGPLFLGQHHRGVERLLGRGRTIVTD